MKKQTLTPTKIVEIDGSLYYEEKLGAWSIMRLKADLIHEFNQLKEKRSKIGYRLVFYRNYEEFEKQMKKIVKEKGVLPVLMFFEKEMGG